MLSKLNGGKLNNVIQTLHKCAECFECVLAVLSQPKLIRKHDSATRTDGNSKIANNEWKVSKLTFMFL